jgi:hypothetical protein
MAKARARGRGQDQGRTLKAKAKDMIYCPRGAPRPRPVLEDYITGVTMQGLCQTVI